MNVSVRLLTCTDDPSLHEDTVHYSNRGKKKNAVYPQQVFYDLIICFKISFMVSWIGERNFVTMVPVKHLYAKISMYVQVL